MLQEAGEPCPVVDRESRGRGHGDTCWEVFPDQHGLVRSRYDVKIYFAQRVQWRLSDQLDLSLRRGGSPDIRQQDKELIAMDEQTSGCDKGNAILAGPPEDKDRHFVGPGFGQCGPEVRGEELGFIIGKSCFGLRLFSQHPVAEKADLRLDPHGSQEFSEISDSQFSNVPAGFARHLLLNHGAVQPHKNGRVFVHRSKKRGSTRTAREQEGHRDGGKAGRDHACLLGQVARMLIAQDYSRRTGKDNVSEGRTLPEVT